MLDKMACQGRWAEAKEAENRGFNIGQTLGIIGCGAIGRMVARKARCFGMNVIVTILIYHKNTLSRKMVLHR